MIAEVIIRPMFSDKPHNPMVNSGAIIVSSLLKKDWSMADRFDYVSERLVIAVRRDRCWSQLALRKL